MLHMLCCGVLDPLRLLLTVEHGHPAHQGQTHCFSVRICSSSGAMPCQQTQAPSLGLPHQLRSMVVDGGGLVHGGGFVHQCGVDTSLRGVQPLFTTKGLDLKTNTFWHPLCITNEPTHQAVQVLLLENVRFNAGEEACDSEFTAQLASLGDVFVNDAFGVCHRDQASVTCLARAMPRKFPGLLVRKELEYLTSKLQEPERCASALASGGKMLSAHCLNEQTAWSCRAGTSTRTKALAGTLASGRQHTVLSVPWPHGTALCPITSDCHVP